MCSNYIICDITLRRQFLFFAPTLKEKVQQFSFQEGKKPIMVLPLAGNSAKLKRQPLITDTFVV